MTTKNRVIRMRGVVDDVLAGGVEIPVHRTTSCGLAAVTQETVIQETATQETDAQETGQTNIRLSSV
jgi:hypothetical protein